MAKKRKEINLDDLEGELAETDEELEETEEEEAKIEEIDEFNLEDVSAEEEVSEVFKEEIEEEIEEEEAPEEEIIDERIYTIPLSKARKGPRTKWAKKAIRFLREYIYRHFKPEYLVISQEVNEKIWERGIQKPPRKIKVRATKNSDGLVVVYLFK
ncbi:MAG: 60S ribosomal protein L31 [Candidatus Lokiarchaeota archaeon]|nr:60S ribosomal protein L31 [Candidatus Lokiarchaeota archaeon]